MPKFAANLSLMFREYPFIERFAEAKANGFDAVEVLFPYDEAGSDIARRLADLDLTMVLINCPPPNYAGGERGFAAVPGLEARFQKDFRRSLRYAELLRVQRLHIMAGNAKGYVARETFKRNLAWAADEAPDMALTIEPLNTHDMPDYYLNDYEDAAKIIADVDRPNLGLQFDTYHAQLLTGDAVAEWEKWADIVTHIQIAGTPDRHEPVKDEIDYPAFFRALDRSGYKGWVSAEYHPSKRTEEGLGWLKDAS